MSDVKEAIARLEREIADNPVAIISSRVIRTVLDALEAEHLANVTNASDADDAVAEVKRLRRLRRISQRDWVRDASDLARAREVIAKIRDYDGDECADMQDMIRAYDEKGQ